MGLYTLRLSGAGALATARTITRFGRTFVEYDPDGPGGGPATWILSSAGAGSSAGPSTVPNALFTPAVAGTAARVGTPLFYSSPTAVDLAQAVDATTAGGAHPYMVAGLANADALNGQLVGIITDGQISMGAWNFICGTTNLEVGKRYFLSDAKPGMLQVDCPTAAGSTVVMVGQAVTPLTLEVEINVMVRL